MRLKEYNKQKLNLKWISWKYDIFWSNRMNYQTDNNGNYYGKEYIADQAALKLITKLLRKQWT